MPSRSSSDMQATMIEHFLAQCQHPARMLLGFIETDEDVWECPPDPDEAVDALAAEFPTANLIESGIAMAGEDGGLILSPALTGGGSLLVLRDAQTGRAYDLLSDAGCLSADALPVFEILRDARTQQLLKESSGQLVVAFDLENVALLRACGLSATLAAGIEDLPLEQVERFCDSFQFRQTILMPPVSSREERAQRKRRMLQAIENGEDPAATQPATSDNPRAANLRADPVGTQLVFLGWTPAELSSAVPARLPVMVDHLRQLERFLDVRLDDFGLWEVDEETIERLRFIAARRCDAVFRQALQDAVENIDLGIGQFGQARLPAIGPPQDYTAALARFHKSSSAEGGSGRTDPHDRNDAWRDVQRLLSQQVVGPLRDLALATQNPVECNLLMGFAELSHVFHLQSVLMGEDLSRRIAEGSGRVPEDQFKYLMALTDRLIGLAKATERCSPPAATIIASRISDARIIPRLTHSD